MYKTTIGIEVHVELKTAKKMFSKASNTYSNRANTNVSAVDIAYPGTLPVLNKEAVELALTAALLLNCKINKKMHFDRKNYFYPDNAKAYQITQSKTPIGIDGYIEIDVLGKTKKIRISDIHIEEDTAKSMHRKDKSLLDFNRAGVPLVEIVSDADMNSPEEAVAYLTKLREILLYGDISDVKIEEGSMRCDANVSISKGEKLGTRTEIKNIGSISNVGLAIEAEVERQKKILENGGIIEEETRKYDEKNNETILLRKKDSVYDYRYFPEPNIPFLIITEEDIKRAEERLPMSPDKRREIYLKNNILEVNVEKLLSNKSLSDYLNRFIDKTNLVTASNLLLGDLSSYLNKEAILIEDTKLNDDKFIELVKLYDEAKINSKSLKEILDELMESNKSVIEILKEKNLLISDDLNKIEEIVEKVIDDNEASVKDFLSGNERALKHLMGMIMKESKGKIRPDLANKILLEKLKSL